jgi:hypothetical protein
VEQFRVEHGLIDGAPGLRGRTFAPIAALAGVVAGLSLLLAPVASAATVNVCRSRCAFRQVSAAVAAASPGDTISVARGTYNGGFTIDKSLRLVGAGSEATIIEGGGPVVTIGTFGAASEPNVSISGVMINGGITNSSPESTPFVGQEGVLALGGGIEIPPNADFSGGATVTIANSVITGNQAAPSTAIDSGLPCPPDVTITCINGDLPFAQAGGGGIDTWDAHARRDHGERQSGWIGARGSERCGRWRDLQPSRPVDDRQ